MSTVYSLAERPDLAGAMVAMPSSWPAFIRPDPVLVHWVFERHPEFQLVLIGDDGAVVARAAAVPLRWSGNPADLPDTGWDEALRMCLDATYDGGGFDTLCALEVAVAPGHRGRARSAAALSAVTGRARAAGLRDVIVPVRPSRKSDEPRTPIIEYAHRRRPDGLPADPWLRVHARAGGELLQVCPAAMTVAGGLRQWRAWTGLPFDTSGPVDVPGALVPVAVDTARDHAVYVEPNVWVRHRLSREGDDR